jgi:glycosyl transferase family 25
MPRIPIFVINLDRATERLTSISRQFETFGLDFERVPAVDGSLLTAAYKRSLNPPRLIGGEMSDGEIGCFASHLRVFQIIVDRCLPRACVMEDDISIGPGAVGWLDSHAPLPGDCDILKIEGIIRPKTTVLPISEYAGQKIVFSWQVSYGTAAYIITLDGARRALRRLAKMGSPIDHALFRYWENGLHVYEVHPFPVRQDDRATNYIQENRVAVIKVRTAKTLVRRLHRRFTKTAAGARIVFYQLRHFGFKMFRKVPAEAGSQLRSQGRAPNAP